jgi:hypothetical protein
MVNLKLIETAPHWRVAVVALVAKALGITVKVEGIPFGSRRRMKPWTPKMVSAGSALGKCAAR